MRLTRVTGEITMVTGTNVNWALVVEGDAVTLVDAGYPNDAASVVRSLAAIGRNPQDVAAIVLTHAHLDHMGGIPALARRSGAPVHTGAEEARHARREYLQQITPLEMLGQCRSRAGVTWVAQTLRAVLPHVRMALPDVVAVPADVPLDVPGRLVPVATPGHTSGHTAYLHPGAGVLFSGDALVTGHPLSRLPEGPQLLPGVFNEDERQLAAALDRLRTVPADTLVPGHGPTLNGPLPAAVDRALAGR
ncbi:MBL fold metallo-hydrolase [Geodermatophilus sp. SYSU D00691]